MYAALEILGTIAFAISGAMVATEKKMDILGVIILGMTTAIGGGIIRDVLTGITPPLALQNPLYALVSIAVSIIVFLPFIRKRINVNDMLFIVIDAIGLGTFTVVGIESVSAFSNVFLQVLLGVVTGVGGGVFRDIFACEKPMIFVRHFYAVASLIGAILCVILYSHNKSLAMILGIAIIVIIRVLAAKFKWHLPKA